MKQKKPSYTELRESLKCANAEAQGYLDEVGPLRDELKALIADNERLGEACDFWVRLCKVLMRAMEDAQDKPKRA